MAIQRPKVCFNFSALIDSTQAVVASYAYDPFGQLMKKSGTLDQPYTFSTKEVQTGTGQYYYGYRFYDSCSGKWTTRDPLGEEGGLNLYSFTQNNPVNKIDPLGLLTWVFGMGGSAVVVRGGEASGGFAISSDGIRSFYSLGKGGGFNVSVDAFVGLFNGKCADLKGKTLNLNAVASSWSATVYFDGDGNVAGITVGKGPGIPAGASSTFSDTTLIDNTPPEPDQAYPEFP